MDRRAGGVERERDKETAGKKVTRNAEGIGCKRVRVKKEEERG